MNQTSSRSHSIFTIVIECAENSKEKGDHIRVGKLNLVDLAGSERQSKVSQNTDNALSVFCVSRQLSPSCYTLYALCITKMLKHLNAAY